MAFPQTWLLAVVVTLSTGAQKETHFPYHSQAECEVSGSRIEQMLQHGNMPATYHCSLLPKPVVFLDKPSPARIPYIFPAQ